MSRPSTLALLVAAASLAFAAAGVAATQERTSFAERCADPGVVLCDPLDDDPVTAVGVTDRTPNMTLPEALRGKYRDWRWCREGLKKDGNAARPEIDRAVKASGSGSLRFTIPTNSGAGASGYCQVNFTPDNSVQFGEGDTFFVQFRVRFSCELLYVDCNPASPKYKIERRRYKIIGDIPGGFKVSIVNAGDHPQLEYPVDSCSRQHLVLNNGHQLGAVTGYHSCGWYDGHTRTVRVRRGGPQILDVQPKATNGAHCWNRHPDTGARLDTAWRDCVMWWADEWMTVTQQVTVGRWAASLKDPARSSNYRLWIAREGQAPVLTIDYDRNLRIPEEPFMKYGKIWLLPYHTKKDPAEAHPEAYMWFDELIVSRAAIGPAK